MTLPAEHLVLFDGVCGLCTSSVQLVFRLDSSKVIHFAPLQSELGREVCLSNGLDPEEFDTFIYARPNHPILVRSSAALALASTLGFPWKLLTIFRLVPRPLRDAVYAFIAKNRHRWFGSHSTCYIPTPEQRVRFHS